MPRFLQAVDAAVAESEAEPTLDDLEHAFQLTRRRLADAEQRVTEITAELDDIEHLIAARVRALGLRHHTVKGTP